MVQLITCIIKTILKKKIFINLGDLGTAYQCLKLAICFDSHHAESYNNLAV